MLTRIKKAHYSDILFLTVLALIGAALTIWIFGGSRQEGNWLDVRQEGKLLLSLALDQDTEKTITTDKGQSNSFYIKDGTVTMKEANCGDHTCIQTGSISCSGESIVCLPHRLTLTIRNENGAQQEQPDAIVR